MENEQTQSAEEERYLLPYEAILSNGDRASGQDLGAALAAARQLRNDAVAHGASPRIGRETIVTKNDVYDCAATNLARDGASR